MLSAVGALAAPADPAVIELPAYTVVETRELPAPESWSYGRIEGFEVLSSASERATKGLVRDFQRFSQALEIVWPGVQRPTGLPVSLILCGRGGSFGQFAPAAGIPVDLGKVSMALRTREQSAIVIDYETKTLGIVLAGRASTGDDLEVDAHQQLFREYIRFLLGAIEPPVPAWFSEGMGQILMAMEVSNTSIVVGRVEDPNLRQIRTAGDGLADWDRGFAGALQQRALMPMEQFFAVTAESAEARNPIGSLWAKQAAAFVHWGLYGNHQRDQKAFLRFLLRVGREPVSEELFKECFKRSYQDMLSELRSYADFTVYSLREFRAKKGQGLTPPPPLELRDATQAEIGRIKGDALRLAGQTAAAKTAMLAAYMRGERDANLLAALGLHERSEGDEVRARKFLEAAVQGGAVRPRAYLELARIRFVEARANPAGAGGRLDASQVSSVIDLLLTACRQFPGLPEVYELAALAWVDAAVPPAAAALGFVDEGVRRFPRHANLLYHVAVLKIRAGSTSDAAMLIRMGRAAATTTDARLRFDALESQLPASRPPAK